MKFFNSVGPNPRVVRMFAAERGLALDMENVDLMGGENRRPEYMARNPSGTTPALQTDDGAFIAEITAICEYLDDKAGNSSLIGTTPEERAETRMWSRRIDLQIMEPLANGFRSSEGLPMFKDRVRTMPHAADDMKTLAQERITWLNGLMEGKQFVCGDRFTMTDILLYCFLDFGIQVGQPLNTANSNIVAWFDRVKSRASASA